MTDDRTRAQGTDKDQRLARLYAISEAYEKRLDTVARILWENGQCGKIGKAAVHLAGTTCAKRPSYLDIEWRRRRGRKCC